MRRLWLAVVLLLSATPVLAQTPTVTVGQTYQVQADATGVNTTGYRLYVDAAKVVDVPVTQLTGGKITLTAPALPARGAHTLTVSAYNQDAESQSAPLTFSGVLPAPGAPTGITIIINITIPGGGGQ